MAETAVAAVPYAENAHACTPAPATRRHDSRSASRACGWSRSFGGAAWMVWTFSGVVTPLPVAIGVAVFVTSARSSSGTRESKSA